MSQNPKSVSSNITGISNDISLKKKTKEWMDHALKYNYSYGFSWMGRPIIQQPQDMIGMQQLIWSLKPDLIIETGIAHGGSLIFYASLLELIGEDGEVVGIDIDIRKHNRIEIEKHKMAHRIVMLEGSSIDNKTVEKVHRISAEKKMIMVVLDSNHTHDHVLKELRFYAPLVTKGSYAVVFDTRIEDIPPETFKDRPWGKGNNPKTAVWEFLKENDRFEIDKGMENKLLITAAPDGYLKCIKD
jgi:cephalosporin hydroxylase